MSNFELLNLSPYEFEELSRDILQIREKVTFENFSEGQDDGVDLRYSRELNNSIIVQAKRYKAWSSFFQIIKKEKQNVIDLNPDRYIITTTVKLGKKEKDKITQVSHFDLRC